MAAAWRAGEGGAQKRQAVKHSLPLKNERADCVPCGRSNVGLRLAQALHAIAGLPLAAFLEEIDAFEALQDVALNDDAAGALETLVLGHGEKFRVSFE
jgi:hypothetical protein